MGCLTCAPSPTSKGFSSRFQLNYYHNIKWITFSKNLEDMIELKNNFIKVLQNETANFAN